MLPRGGRIGATDGEEVYGTVKKIRFREKSLPSCPTRCSTGSKSEEKPVPLQGIIVQNLTFFAQSWGEPRGRSAIA